MSGLQSIILRRDFTLSKKKSNSSESHIHYRGGSYLIMEGVILKSKDMKQPPVLIFQEGIGVPKGIKSISTATQIESAHPLENVKWDTWYVPMLRGLNRQKHGKGLGLGKIFNRKTIVWWIVGLALLSFAIGMVMQHTTPTTTPSDNIHQVVAMAEISL